MRGLRWILCLPLFALCLGTACGDNDLEGFGAGADGAVGSSVDAAVPADANPPSADAESNDPPIEFACSLDELQPIIECVTDNCLEDIADGNLATCVTFSCGLLFLTLPSDCSQCLLAGLSGSSMALDACVTGLDDLDGGFPIPPAA